MNPKQLRALNDVGFGLGMILILSGIAVNNAGPSFIGVIITVATYLNRGKLE